MGTEIAEDLAVRVDRVRAFLEREPQDDVEAFLARVPRAYLLAVEPERVARHYPTIQPPVGALDVRAVHLEGGRAGTYELLVVARDRAGLLSWIAGSARARRPLDPHRAGVHDGRRRRDRPLRGRRGVGARGARPALARVPGRAPTGDRRVDLGLERRVEEKRRWYPPPAVSTPVSVVVDDGASDFATVIEVGAPDRLGLLYDITRTLSELGLDVHLATVATYEGRVVDSFYVRDDLGRKFTGDPSTVDASCGTVSSRPPPERPRSVDRQPSRPSDLTSRVTRDTRPPDSRRTCSFLRSRVASRRRRRTVRPRTRRWAALAIAMTIASLALPASAATILDPSMARGPLDLQAADGHEARRGRAAPRHDRDVGAVAREHARPLGPEPDLRPLQHEPPRRVRIHRGDPLQRRRARDADRGPGRPLRPRRPRLPPVGGHGQDDDPAGLPNPNGHSWIAAAEQWVTETGFCAQVCDDRIPGQGWLKVTPGQ